ncbi:putative Arylsulfotransferase protein [Lasiodiplodia theobromae]|nr:putative Arylsulfotransferase protein [Lasiodiplodia theobromae]
MVGFRTLWPAAAVLLWLPVATGIDLWVVNDESVMPTSLFLSRPDITPPELDITVYKPEAITPGYFFLAPWRRPRGGPDHGPYIYDNDGNLVWSGAASFGGINAYNPHVCQHNSKDHLCFFQGEGRLGYAKGVGMVLDSSYDLVKMVKPSGSLSGTADMHEFQLADDGRTALMTIYQTVPYDLSPFGITGGFGWIVEAVFQEVAVDTGEVVFEWRSLDHEETSPLHGEKILPGNTLVGGRGVHPITPWDYFHINAIDKDADGNYLISSRHLSTIFKLSGDDGRVLWQLAGDTDFGGYERLDFNFSSQHDARELHKNATHSTISLFDNASNSWKWTARHSRGLVFSVDHTAQTATLLSEFAPPAVRPHNESDPLSAGSQGNLQVLSNGNAVVGYGEYPFFAEHAPDGELLLWGAISRNNSFMMHYRAQKFNWTASPREAPTMFVYSLDGHASGTVFYVSWNGATEVAMWKFYAGPAPGGPWDLVGSKEKEGFETRFQARGYYQEWSYVEAVDKDGNVLRKSTVYKTFRPGDSLKKSCDEWRCKVMDAPPQPSKEEQDSEVKLTAEDVDWENVKYNNPAEGLRPLLRSESTTTSWWKSYGWGVVPLALLGLALLLILAVGAWSAHKLYAKYRSNSLSLISRRTYQKVENPSEETS